MGRRQSRETALQVMFQIDIGRSKADQAINHVAEEMGISQDDLKFTRFLVEGTIQHLADIDEVLSRLSREWNINRMANVDRNIMRLALFEILYCSSDIPPAVSVNEAVEIAKTFGGYESQRFINGILGNVVKNLESFKEPVSNE